MPFLIRHRSALGSCLRPRGWRGAFTPPRVLAGRCPRAPLSPCPPPSAPLRALPPPSAPQWGAPGGIPEPLSGSLHRGAIPLPTPSAAIRRLLPHPPPKRGLPGGIPAPLLFPCAFLLAGGQPPGPLVPRPRAGGALRGRHRSPSDGFSGLVRVRKEFSTLFFLRNIHPSFPLLMYDRFSRHSRRRSRCYPIRFHPSKWASVASITRPGTAIAAPSWAQLCTLLRYFFINSLNANHRIFVRL